MARRAFSSWALLLTLGCGSESSLPSGPAARGAGAANPAGSERDPTGAVALVEPVAGGPSSGFGEGAALFGAPDAGLDLDDARGARGPGASDPETCEGAAESKSYVGCDYWPTVVANNVWSIFDFAVVVANGQDVDAEVRVTGPGGVDEATTVPAGSLSKIYLPWVDELKGPEPDSCGVATPVEGSTLSTAGAYHLVTSVPVTVYQFSPLEYREAGGPPGKDWSACPGSQVCPLALAASGCFSFSNDASLLLPSTAMTGNYRVMGIHGWSERDAGGDPYDVMGAYFAITATQDDTAVDVLIADTGEVVAGNSIDAVGPGEVLTLRLDRGDVAQIVSPIGRAHDLSGSLVAADKPVQVLSGVPCINLPEGAGNCDHVQESVPPAETLGRQYLVAAPSGPAGNVVDHIVRIYGNADATRLSYAPFQPAGCPDSIGAGEVADCGVVSGDFQVSGDREFGVASFMLGATVVDSQTAAMERKGDPSQSVAVAVEQYRSRYVFLAPDDYDVSYVDIIAPDGVDVVLDGASLQATFSAIGDTGYGVARVLLGPGRDGAHSLVSTLPVGIQVMGYGAATSYHYPGGLNLSLISEPPPMIIR